jgi:hypothetical protein
MEGASFQDGSILVYYYCCYSAWARAKEARQSTLLNAGTETVAVTLRWLLCACTCVLPHMGVAGSLRSLRLPIRLPDGCIDPSTPPLLHAFLIKKLSPICTCTREIPAGHVL